MGIHRLSPEKILNGYYYNRDQEAYREALLQLLAIIANSFLTTDVELDKIRTAVSELDKQQQRFE